jgi:hypothetical protein
VVVVSGNCLVAAATARAAVAAVAALACER